MVNTQPITGNAFVPTTGAPADPQDTPKMSRPVAPPSYGDVLLAVEQLTEQRQTDEEFFSRLLKLLITTLNASGGYIWQAAGDSVLTPIVKSMSHLEDSPDLTARERDRAQRVYEKQLPLLSPANDNPNAPRNLQRCCLLAPLFDQTRCYGVISLISYVHEKQHAEAQMSLLIGVADRVCKYHLFHHYAQSAEQLSALNEAHEVMAGVSKYIETKPLAFEVVNRLEKYLQADRVALAFRRGEVCQIKGISNQAVFDRRSSIVRSLERLSARIAQIEEPLWYPSPAEELAPSLTRMLDQYLEVSNTLSIALLPLFGERKRRDDPNDIAATIQSDDDRRECIGVLILEGIQRPLEQELVLQRWQRVKSAVSHSVANARTHDGLFLMPLWRSLGFIADLYRGHTKRKSLLITGSIAAVIAAVMLVPADFKLRGDGVIQPVHRQHVFAETDGTVDQLFFTDGQQVSAGELLINLKNPEQAAKLADVEGKLREAEKQLETLTYQRVGRSFENEQEERELVRNAAATEVRVEGLKEQYALLLQSRQQLQIKSPMSGQVVTWDTRQRLTDRPVKRGERLLTVALATGGWEVELRIPDKRAGYLLKQWSATRADGEPMEVSFVLASNPHDVYRGTVYEVSPNTNVDDKVNENVVRVRIKLSEAEFARMHAVKPGTTVIGHVHCGQTSIGYSKLYEFFDWSRRMWFRFIS